jgi:hypothetical protein
MKTVAFLGLAFLMFALTVKAGNPLQRASKVTVKPVEQVLIHAGGTASAKIIAVIESDFHIQANPASEKYLIPTVLTVKAVSGVVTGKPVYPKATPFQLEGSSDKIATYSGQIEITLPLKAEPNSSGDHDLEGSLRYQACDAKSCFPPATAPLKIQVHVIPAGH